MEEAIGLKKKRKNCLVSAVLCFTVILFLILMKHVVTEDIETVTEDTFEEFRDMLDGLIRLPFYLLLATIGFYQTYRAMKLRREIEGVEFEVKSKGTNS